jgi:hypothetical protein
MKLNGHGTSLRPCFMQARLVGAQLSARPHDMLLVAPNPALYLAFCIMVS